MCYMFYKCSSIININLSSFETKKVITVRQMFSGCSSLTNINLSNFNTKYLNISMWDMFGGYKSLKKENVITNDESILNIFKYRQ